jgi:hypothetical protein
MTAFRSAIGRAVIAALLASPVAAAHSEYLITQADPDVLLDVAKGFGSATMDKDNSGDPMISGRMQGLKYVIYFYGCKEALNCRSFQFATGYTDAWTMEKANEWNAKYRWIRAYEKDGSNFRMDVALQGGVSRRYVEEQFSTWESFVEDIKSAATAQ